MNISITKLISIGTLFVVIFFLSYKLLTGYDVVGEGCLLSFVFDGIISVGFNCLE